MNYFIKLVLALVITSIIAFAWQPEYQIPKQPTVIKKSEAIVQDMVFKDGAMTFISKKQD